MQTVSLSLEARGTFGNAERFDEILLRCVEDGLAQLGRDASQILFHYLAKDFGLAKEEIPGKPEHFARGLETILAHGARYLEKQIIKRLYERLDLRANSANFAQFAEQVARAKDRWSSAVSDRTSRPRENSVPGIRSRTTVGHPLKPHAHSGFNGKIVGENDSRLSSPRLSGIPL